MKVINKAIEVVHYDKEGDLIPLAIRYEEKKFPVLKVYERESKRHAGKEIIDFTCLIKMHNREKFCGIRYSIDSCIWTLYKL